MWMKMAKRDLLAKFTKGLKVNCHDMFSNENKNNMAALSFRRLLKRQ
jgi:hypothetical protein